MNPILNELKDIAPLLGKLRKPAAEQLGPVPKGYFEQLPKHIEQKLEIQQELEALVPTLAAMEKPPLGELPKGYFEQLEQRLQAKLEPLQELEEESSFLGQMQKSRPGGIPADYFEGFEDRLMERIKAEDTATRSKVLPLASKPWWRRSSVVMSIAASFLLLVLGAVWWVRGELRSPYQQMMAMNIEQELQYLSLAEANQYLIQHIDELETEELVDVMSEEEFNALQQSEQASFLPTVSSDTIPPKPNPQQKTSTPKTQNTDPKPNATSGFQQEIEEDVLESTNLEDLVDDLNDDDFTALEAALLNPKKEQPKNNTKQKSNKQ